MTTYIALFNLTDAGIKAAKDSPRRLDTAKKLLADMGGEMKQFYMVMGEFDFVGICSEVASGGQKNSPDVQFSGPRGASAACLRNLSASKEGRVAHSLLVINLSSEPCRPELGA